MVKLTGKPSLAYRGVEASSPPNTTVHPIDPTTTDYYNFNIGDFWLNRGTTSAPLNKLWVLTNKANHIATWVLIVNGGGGPVLSLRADDGNTAFPNGVGTINIQNVDGNIVTTAPIANTILIDLAPSITVLNNITANTGDINALLGNSTIHGNITSQIGNITATLGDIVATTGNITALLNITSTSGNITATAGNVSAGSNLGTGSLSAHDISNAITPAQIITIKNRAGGAVQPGDSIGEVDFKAFDGTNTIECGAVSARIPATATIGANRIATILEFWGRPDAISATPLVYMKIDETGNRIATHESAFFAWLDASILNATGDNTVFIIPFNTVEYDQNGNYNNATGVFTAPATGKYLFTTSIWIRNIGAAHNVGQFRIACSNGIRLFMQEVNPFVCKSANDWFGFVGSGYIDMVAGDTSWIEIVVFNSTKTITIYGINTEIQTFFQGHLVC